MFSLGGLALLLCAVGLRILGAALRTIVVPRFLAVLGWPLAAVAAWMVTLSLGAWTPLWFALLVALLGVVAELSRQRRWTWPLADALMVLLVGISAIPPMTPLPLLVAVLLAVGTGMAVDYLFMLLSNRQRGIFIGGLMVAGAAGMWLLPNEVEGAVRLIGTRVANTAFVMPFSGSSRVPAYQPPTESALNNHTLIPIAANAPQEPIVAQQLSTLMEWTLSNPTYDGNPFDLVATATFTHEVSGETRTTGMFYNGGDEWRFRFTATQAGAWSYATMSSDPELNGHSGSFVVAADPDAPGFVTADGQRWIRSGTGAAFVPQFVMFKDPDRYYQQPEVIDEGIQLFFVDHGFNGFQIQVYCRWFDIAEQSCDDINVADPNPDIRTFEALESLISRTYSAGGTVHLWAWGDDSRGQNPKRWGLNGSVDQRLQRYIAARLGPMPGWTMGYGFDLFEWVTGDELAIWHDYLHAHMGWKHMLGARANKNELNQLTEVLDYSSYEQHRPDYDKYVETIETRPDKPSFSEDRFRIRDEGREKDYSFEDTRLGLWHSTMAGGVANIWGNLDNDRSHSDGSAPYPNVDQIRTYATFFAERFTRDIMRCTALSDAYCLMRPDRKHYVFYHEKSTAIQMDLSAMDGPQRAVAVDALLPYAEIDLGILQPEQQTWQAPYESDWAIAIAPEDEAQAPPSDDDDGDPGDGGDPGGDENDAPDQDLAESVLLPVIKDSYIE